MADATTAEKALTDAYQEIITGACLITLREGLSVRLAFASTTPAQDDPFHLMNRENSPASYTGGLKVYARVDDSSFGTTTKISYTGV